jgi:hypothetical protein
MEKKKYITEIEVCKYHINDFKLKGLDEAKLTILQQKFSCKVQLTSITAESDMLPAANKSKY